MEEIGLVTPTPVWVVQQLEFFWRSVYMDCRNLSDVGPLTVDTATDVINSLAPGKFEWNFIHVIFKQILVIDCGGISCEIALIWMSLDFTDDQSTLVLR